LQEESTLAAAKLRLAKLTLSERVFATEKAAAKTAALQKSSYFFINSSTATVIAFTPVRIVVSGTGQNRLECSDGNGTPVFGSRDTSVSIARP